MKQAHKNTLMLIFIIIIVVSSVRSSNNHPDLLLITTPLFQITPVLNTGLSLSEPLKLYKGYNDMRHSQMLGKVESGEGPIFKVVLEC